MMKVWIINAIEEDTEKEREGNDDTSEERIVVRYGCIYLRSRKRKT
jgi:hypothetical protein